MKMRAATALLLSLPACDSTGMKVLPLTEGQATTILREIVDLSLWVEEGRNVVRCPFGGGAWVTVTEDVMESEDTTFVSTRWTIAPDRCEILTEGDTLILEGDPSVVFESEFWYRGFFEEGEVDMTAAGAVAWRRVDDISVPCEIDLAMEDAEVDVRGTGEIDGSLEGRLCEYDVAVHFSDLGPAG